MISELILSTFVGPTVIRAFEVPFQQVDKAWHKVFTFFNIEKQETITRINEVNPELANELSLELAQDLKYQQVFQSEIVENIKLIPENDIQPAQSGILYPFFKVANDYLDSEDLRKLFAKLIAASFDSRKNSSLHPCFSEIIKQMSPVDAQNLNCFKKMERLPICEYRVQDYDANDRFHIKYTNVFLSNPNQTDIRLQSLSIINLERLGLINIQLMYSIDESFYIPFFEHPIYKSLETLEILEVTPEPRTESECRKIIDREVEVIKGSTSLTELGKAFIEVCF